MRIDIKKIGNKYEFTCPRCGKPIIVKRLAPTINCESCGKNFSVFPLKGEK
jgi:ribosomal protein L37AE/L43A